eukprot:scpid58860/ scgid0871/ 
MEMCWKSLILRRKRVRQRRITRKTRTRQRWRMSPVRHAHDCPKPKEQAYRGLDPLLAQVNHWVKEREFAKENQPRHLEFTLINEFKNFRMPEYLCISAGKLFCEVCHAIVQPKKSVVKTHILSMNHQLSKERRAKAKAHQATLTKSCRVYEEKNAQQLVGTGLTKAVGDNAIPVVRANVVESFLKAGIPLTKIDCIRPVLEHNNAKLTYSSHMAQLIPFLTDVELDRLKEEIKRAEYIAVIFDGTTHLGEALAIIIRFVDSSWSNQQRLVRLHVLAKSLKGTELARELITCLSTFFQVPHDKTVAFVRDGAAVNTVAVRQVRDLVYPRSIDIVCASHGLIIYFQSTRYFQ